MKNKVIVWLHMHQPEYFNPIAGIQYLPWVRRHLAGGYYTVANLLKKYPAKININFSGVLLAQILRYTENFIDYYDYLERKDASSLSESEANFIINKFLIPMNNFDNKRFAELIGKKQRMEKFTTNDLRDSQVLFTLSAFSPLNNEASEFLGKNSFTESDKEEVKRIEKRAIKAVLPLYKELSESGIIELTATPMYHPILPLLVDTNSAKESKPDSVMPYSRFLHPEDADEQIKEGLTIFERVFGEKPKGMWPSEGSISAEVIELIKENGIEWVGTDEAILRKSLGGNPEGLVYASNGVKIIFRNHTLSDKIAFVYNKMNPQDAASDFENCVVNSGRTEVVILDGENPWEYYENKGVDFLTEWFKKLQNISIKGSEAETEGEIEKIAPGSWINGFFDTWIGHKESNIAWDYLTEAREKLGDNEEAMKEIRIAEGSDWFWWYSDFHKNEVDFSFDTLFRMHLIKAYELSGEIIPGYLFYPIKEAK